MNKKAKLGVTVWDFYVKKNPPLAEETSSEKKVSKKKQALKKRSLLHGTQSNDKPQKKFEITKVFDKLDRKEKVDKETKKRLVKTAASLIRAVLFTDEKEKAGIFPGELVNIGTGQKIKPLFANIVNTKFKLTTDGRFTVSFRIDKTNVRFTLISTGKSKTSFKNNLEKFKLYFNTNAATDLLKEGKIRKWLKIK